MNTDYTQEAMKLGRSGTGTQPRPASTPNESQNFFGDHTVPASVLTDQLETLDKDTVQTYSLVPDKDVARDLGSPKKRYRRIYGTGIIPTTQPTSPVIGESYLDLANFRLYVWTGTQWRYAVLQT